MKRGTSRLKTKAKRKFLLKYKQEAAVAVAQYPLRNEWRKDIVYAFVEKARKELVYSEHTYWLDIYGGLVREWQKMVQEHLI